MFSTFGARATIFAAIFITLSIAVWKYGRLQESDSTPKNNSQLIVGMLPADAPFYSLNAMGTPEGFDVDVAHAIGQHLHKEVVFLELGVPELFIALQAGKIDLFLCGLSITRKRLEKINMVHYQGSGVSTFPLVFWQQAPQNITSLSDLSGKNTTIAVLPATLQEDFARQHSGITVKTVDSYAQIIMELQYGKVTAALFDEAISGFVAQFPQLVVVNVPIGDFESLGHGIAIRKENSALTADVARAVTHLKQAGSISRFEARWGLGSGS